MAQGFVYGGNTVLSHPIFVETILPFILLFTVVFAILQKAQIFGKDKKQIDALVALVVGLLVISFAQATGVILQMTVFLAVSLVVILVLLLLLGSFAPEGKFFDKEGPFPGWLRMTLIIVALLAVVIAVVYFTGFWETLYDWVYVGTDSSVFVNVLFIAIVIGAVIAVIAGGKAKKDH